MPIVFKRRRTVSAFSSGFGGSVAVITPIQQLTAGLTADGVFSKLDRLWVFAQVNETAALMDLIGGNLATNVSATAFEVNRGFTGDGVADNIDSNFNPVSTPGNFIQDSACLFGWNNNADGDGDAGTLCGLDSFSTRIMVNFDGTPGQSQWGVNGGAAAVADTGFRGFYLVNRSGANAQTLDINGSQFDTSAVASGAVDNTDFFALRGPSGFSDHQISCMGFGGSLSAGERVAIYNRLRTYMTAVGVP